MFSNRGVWLDLFCRPMPSGSSVIIETAFTYLRRPAPGHQERFSRPTATLFPKTGGECHLQFSSSVDQLKQLTANRADVFVHLGDCNEDRKRALCLLDPYNMPRRRNLWLTANSPGT
jgi:hypothetical protein